MEEDFGLFFSTSIQKYQYLRIVRMVEEYENQIGNRDSTDEESIYNEKYKKYMIWI